MKKGKFFAVAGAVLLILAMTITTASAEGTVGFDSSFQVLNLGSNAATIAITYYNPDGSLAAMPTGVSNPVNDTIAIGQSNTYFAQAATGFKGSLVIASSEKVAAISSIIVNTSAKGMGSYVGFTAGATKIYYPSVQKANSSNTTTLAVQNTGDSAADITIHFTPEAGSSYPTITDVTDSLPIGASHFFDLSSLSAFSAVTKWVGSATVSVTDTANDTIAGVANTMNTKYTDAYQLYTYNALLKGSTSVQLPLIQENNAGNRTSINCQNIDPATTTDVTVTYTPEAGSAAKAPDVKQSVGPGGGAVFLQNYLGATKFVGSALVTSSPAVPLVCVVNQQKPAGGRASSYEGFDPADATGTVVFPLIQSRNGSDSLGYTYTSMNLATRDGLSHPIQCTFSPAPGFNTPAAVSKTGASVVFLQNDVFGTGSKFVGGATCTITDASGVGLFGIVNQSRLNTPQAIRDTLSSYDGFNPTS